MRGKRLTELDKILADYLNTNDSFWLQDVVRLYGEPAKVRIRTLQIKNKVQCCTIGRGNSKRQNERKFLVLEKIKEEDFFK